jgi:NAD(P)-dependent dehydrogenase (short-subunit alcohol dehydrogenase family)
MGLLDDRVALITGAGAGLGRSHALAFAKEGAKVVVNDLGCEPDGSGGEASLAGKVVDEIKELGGDAIADTHSVNDAEGAKAMVELGINEFGKLDILVNNAAILRDRSFMKMTEDDWDAVISVHLKGAFYVTKQAFAHMREKGYGRIIMTTSTAGLFGNFGQANYSAAKAGLYGMMMTLAKEGAKYGITVNCLAPAAYTRLTVDMLSKRGVTQEQLDPGKVSPAVVYLCSEAAADISGQVVYARGNRIRLINMTWHEVAERPIEEPAWDPAEAGDMLRQAVKELTKEQ